MRAIVVWRMTVQDVREDQCAGSISYSMLEGRPVCEERLWYTDDHSVSRGGLSVSHLMEGMRTRKKMDYSKHCRRFVAIKMR